MKATENPYDKTIVNTVWVVLRFMSELVPPPTKVLIKVKYRF